MSNRKTKPAVPKKQPETTHLTRKQVPCVTGETAEATALNYAKLILSPEMASFRVITNREREELIAPLDTPTLIDALRAQAQAVHQGDMKAAEAMLINQATALQSLFVKLTETGLQASLLRQQETALRLALKAQSQCRATLETLANIKNPPVVYAKAACILPHGVLFRGNAEADIRRNLIRHGYIEGIIGLPANLFYGTGIPACIIVIDKAEAQARKGIFMVDASSGLMKDGPKNRLREQDIHRIVDVFTKRTEVPKYARMVSLEEIERNDFNLNLPRYIDSSTPEDRQDIAAHLQGGIPAADVDALQAYWAVCPQLRQTLFTELRPGYLIAADGWKAETYRVLEEKKNKEGKVTKTVDKGWACDLIPKPLIVARYFFQEQAAIEELSAQLDEGRDRREDCRRGGLQSRATL